MRLPKVGESGWQVKGPFYYGLKNQMIVGEAVFYDCEILAEGDVYGLDDLDAEVTLTVRVPDINFGLSGDVWLADSKDIFRRKPKQKDNQAADEEFIIELKQMLNKRVRA